MHPYEMKNDFLHRFKEDENEIEELSRIEENELLQSPRFKRLQSSSPPPRSNSSSPLKPKINERSSFQKKPILQNPSVEQVPKTPTKANNRQRRVNKFEKNALPTPKYLFKSPTKLHHESKFTDAKVSLTPAQRFEKKPGKLFSTKDILSSYEFKETIGRGAFANVYRAINKLTGDELAIKEIFIEDDDDILELMCEIDLLKILKHKNIVKYHGFIKNDKKLLIFLEYCSGGSLRNVYKKHGPLSEKQVTKYLRQVLEGLIYLHSQGVVHRDVKAANILLTNEGDIKLTDFGVSTKVSTKTIKTYSIAGTPNWMAPEIISMDGTSTASDIWSLGATIVELLTGEPLYSHLNEMAALHAIVTDEYPPIPTFISSTCKDFLLKCFEKQPTKRITAKSLLEHKWLRAFSTKESNKGSSLSTSTMKFDLSQKKTSNHDFNSVKRMRSRKFLPMNTSSFIDSEKELDSIIDDELLDGIDGLAFKDTKFDVSSDHTTSLFEPIEYNISALDSRALKDDLMNDPFNVMMVKKTTNEICANKLNIDILLEECFTFHVLSWIDVIENNEKLLLAHLDLATNIVKKESHVVSDVINFGGLHIFIRLLSKVQATSSKIKIVDLLSKLFEVDEYVIKLFVQSGGLLECMNFLHEDYKTSSKLPMFTISVLKKAFESELISNEVVQFVILNSENRIDWIGILLMETVHSNDLDAANSIVDVITNLQNPKIALIKPIFLNSIFKIYTKLSLANQVKVLKFLKGLNLNELPRNSNILKFLIKTIQKIQQQKSLKHEPLNISCSMIFSCCHLNQEKQVELVKLQVFPIFQELINSTLPCTEYVIPLLCEFPFNHALLPFISKEKESFLRIYTELLIDPVWQANALDSLVAIHERIGFDDSVAKYLLHDEYQFLLNGFLVDKSLNFELYLERLIRFLNSYSSSLTVNQIRLQLFYNNNVLDNIFAKISEHHSDLVVQINLFKLLKIISAKNSTHENFEKVSIHLKEIRPTKVLLIDQLINEILGDEKDKENTLMRPPNTAPHKLVFS